MVADPKPVSPCNFIANLDDLFTGELDQFPALGTVQVVVFGISVIEFIHASPVEFEAMQESCVDELSKRAVDSGSGHVVGCTLGGELIDELVGVEVFMPIEDLFEQVFFLVGVP